MINKKFLGALFYEFVVVFGGPYAINEVLTKFDLDLIKLLHADFGHYVLFCISLGLIRLRKNIPIQKPPPKNDFAEAILTYLNYLKRSGKHRLVVELRNKFSHLFHISNLQSDREKLGLIAFDSAIATGDQLSEAEIRIDDLGWALHQQKKSVEAKNNIEVGLSLVESFSPKNNIEKLRCACIKAKAYRHLSFLSRTENESNVNLKNCETVVSDLLANTDLMKSFEPEIKCAKAQLLHAKATLRVRQTGYHEGSVVRATDSTTISIINTAISEIQEAIKISKEINDIERVIKMLIHYELFLLALGDDANALRAKAERKHYLSESGFDNSMEDSVITQFSLA